MNYRNHWCVHINMFEWSIWTGSSIIPLCHDADGFCRMSSFVIVEQWSRMQLLILIIKQYMYTPCLIRDVFDLVINHWELNQTHHQSNQMHHNRMESSHRLFVDHINCLVYFISRKMWDNNTTSGMCISISSIKQTTIKYDDDLNRTDHPKQMIISNNQLINCTNHIIHSSSLFSSCI